MGWLDRPTEAQISVLWHWFRWKMPTAEAKDALDWLEKNANRKQVSEEMKRIRELYLNNSLTREDCFKGEIWQEYFNAKTNERSQD